MCTLKFNLSPVDTYCASTTPYFILPLFLRTAHFVSWLCLICCRGSLATLAEAVQSTALSIRMLHLHQEIVLYVQPAASFVSLPHLLLCRHHHFSASLLWFTSRQIIKRHLRDTHTSHIHHWHGCCWCSVSWRPLCSFQVCCAATIFLSSLSATILQSLLEKGHYKYLASRHYSAL